MDIGIMRHRKEIAKHYLCNNAPNELEKYSAFLQLYEEVTAPLSVDGSYIIQIDESLLEDHRRLSEVVANLRAHPTQTREQFVQATWNDSDIEKRNAHRATATIVQVGYMLNCNLRDKHSRDHRIGDWTPPQWEEKESFRDYVERAVPKQETGSSEPLQQRHLLKAWKLVKRCNMGIDATDNISEHLLYNPHTNRLRVFSHTNWLHAQLERLGDAEDLELDECLKLGALPRQLILETLNSFHRILFPLTEDKKGKSQDLLKKLIKHKRFDEKADRPENYSQRLPNDFKYYYWGSRLEMLAAIARKPPPANPLQSWMERHKNERFLLWVAIVGLLLSALSGLLASLIGAAQLYVAIIALKQTE